MNLNRPIHRKRLTKQIWGLMRGESIEYDEKNTAVTNTSVTNTGVTKTWVTKTHSSKKLEEQKHGTQPESQKNSTRSIQFILKEIKCAGFYFQIFFFRIDALEIPITLIREVTGARYCETYYWFIGSSEKEDSARSLR